MDYCKIVSAKTKTITGIYYTYDTCGYLCKMTLFGGDAKFEVMGDKAQIGNSAILRDGETVEFVGHIRLHNNSENSLTLRLILFDRV